MALPNFGTAAQQTMLMLQKVNKDIQITQNLEKTLDDLFSTTGPGDEIGLQQYRAPIQTEVGGIGGYYQPDGGAYFQGTGPQYDEMILAPMPILVAVSATELARRIASGGDDVIVENFVSRMIAKVKEKAAHLRNAYLQGYNTTVLATVDGSYAGGNTIQLAKAPFGGRLLDRGGAYAVTDANLNILGTVNVIDVNKNGVGVIDTVTVDAAPAGIVAGSSSFLPIGMASGAPIGINGIQYLVSPSANLEYCGIQRANSYVQTPAYNANGAYLTLGIVEAFKTRMQQALGNERFKKERKNNVWYGHTAQRMSANVLGFAKTMFMSADGKTPSYDIATNFFERFTIAGLLVEEDTMASVSSLYWLDKSTLKRVRYPGSQKIIPGPVEGMFWPRIAGGSWTSQSDVLYQDSLNYYTNLPWANGVIYGLGIQPALSN